MPDSAERLLRDAANQQFVEQLAPSAVVVRENGQIVRFVGDVERYLRFRPGDPTLSLTSLAKPALKARLTRVLRAAWQQRRPRATDVLDGGGSRGRHLRIRVAPLRTSLPHGPLWLVLFEEHRDPGTAPVRREPGTARPLEAQLRALRRDQQQLIDDLEYRQDTLQAAHEEVLTMNDELQRANEALAASKEEVQSMNEELQAVNAELHDRVRELTTINDDVANLLASTEVATLFLDGDLRITRFTSAASRLLNVQEADLGRPIAHLSSPLVDADAAAIAARVIAERTAAEQESVARDGREYLIRAQPYRTRRADVAGVILSFIDVTTLKAAERKLRQSAAELETRVADRTKWLTLMHDVTRAINDAPNADEAVRLVLRRICEQNGWDVATVYAPGRTSGARVAIVECTPREDLQRLPAAGHAGAAAEQTALATRVFTGRVPLWVNGAEKIALLLAERGGDGRAIATAVGIPIELSGEMMGVLELLSLEAQPPNDVLVNLLVDVAVQIGKVLERERAAAEMADLISREQQALLHTLHDSLGQTLTGVGMLSAGVSHQLASTDPALAETARRLTEQAQIALDQVRLLTRGLTAGDVGADGLVPALRELAAATERVHGLPVRFEVTAEAPVRDNKTATHLYRIAQEAVTNALKHANPTAIGIDLLVTPRDLTLRVGDDGNGFSPRSSEAQGLGLRIMAHRAAAIGGRLSIDPAPGGGTVVTCSVGDSAPPKEA